MDTGACTAFFSENFPLWAKLSQTERGLICKMTSEEFFSKGSNIHSGSNECTGAIFIKKGCLRAYILSEDGREITLYRLYKNDICMLSASCVLKSITFDVFVDAEEDSEVYIINGKTFADIAEKNSYVKIFALETAVKRFSSVMWIMQQILFLYVTPEPRRQPARAGTPAFRERRRGPPPSWRQADGSSGLQAPPAGQKSPAGRTGCIW